MKRFLSILCAIFIGLIFSVQGRSLVEADSNLISNPSMETSASTTTPSGWSSDKYGTNKATFRYNTTGHTGSRSLTTSMTSHTSGDAKWYFAPVTVTPSTTYTYSDWFKSTIKSDVDVVATSTTNTTTYLWQGSLAASTNWKRASFTFKTPANVAKITVYHYIRAVGQLTIDDVMLVAGTVPTPTPTPIPAPTAPTVSIDTPTNGATVSAQTSITATAASSTGVMGVQFKIDGLNFGAADTTAPYSTSWDSTSVANGTHTISAVATGTNTLSTTANSNITVANTVTPPTPPAPTAPTVAITAPASGSTVSAATSLTATASDAVSVTKVQFKVDGTDFGAADTVAPYSIAWDSKTVADGTHTVSAVATNNSNLSTTSATISFTVANPVVTPPTPTPTPTPTSTNLLLNPSVETSTNNAPNSWSNNAWGTNTTTFTYENTGHDGSRSIKVNVQQYTNGDAKWLHAPVAVTPGTTYSYSNWYMSSVDSELDAMVTLTNGTVQYYYITGVPASPAAWQKISAQFVAPANAKNVTIFQVLAKVGTIQTDDFTLGIFQPAQFNRALVSLTFDDGWRSIYTNGLPLLNKYGFVSTQYLNSQPIVDGYPDYMTYQMVKDYFNQGSELAWHTQTHADLTTLTQAQTDTELTIPSAFLQGIGQSAATFKNFATPYGAYNTAAVTEIKKFYGTHRSVEEGYNSKDSFNPYNIKVQNMLVTTTAADVQAWVNQAITTKTWLVLVYHEIGTSADSQYSATTANFDAQLNVIKQSGVTVETVAQALNEITPQL